MKAVFPHVSLYMRYSLQSYLKHQEHLSDVLAALMSLDVELVSSQKKRLSTYTGTVNNTEWHLATPNIKVILGIWGFWEFVSDFSARMSSPTF